MILKHESKENNAATHSVFTDKLNIYKEQHVGGLTHWSANIYHQSVPMNSNDTYDWPLLSTKEN